MKKLITILITGMMLVSFAGIADAKLMTWKSSKKVQNQNGIYKVSYALSGFDKKTDSISSIKILVGGKQVYLSSGAYKKFASTGKFTTYINSNGGKYAYTKVAVRGNRNGGGGKWGGGGRKGVPEPSMLALMSLVLLGLGLGPWLRKLQTRSV